MQTAEGLDTQLLKAHRNLGLDPDLEAERTTPQMGTAGGNRRDRI